MGRAPALALDLRADGEAGCACVAGLAALSASRCVAQQDSSDAPYADRLTLAQAQVCGRQQDHRGPAGDGVRQARRADGDAGAERSHGEVRLFATGDRRPAATAATRPGSMSCEPALPPDLRQRGGCVKHTRGTRHRSRPEQEFYALLSFATPGVLGQIGTFKRVYAGGPDSASAHRLATACGARGACQRKHRPLQLTGPPCACHPRAQIPSRARATRTRRPRRRSWVRHAQCECHDRHPTGAALGAHAPCLRGPWMSPRVRNRLLLGASAHQTLFPWPLLALARELQQQAGAFVLRRTQDILTRHLPPLSTFTLFVQPSDLQVAALRGGACTRVAASRGRALLAWALGSADSRRPATCPPPRPAGDRVPGRAQEQGHHPAAVRRRRQRRGRAPRDHGAEKGAPASRGVLSGQGGVRWAGSASAHRVGALRRPGLVRPG